MLTAYRAKHSLYIYTVKLSLKSKGIHHLTTKLVEDIFRALISLLYKEERRGHISLLVNYNKVMRNINATIPFDSLLSRPTQCRCINVDLTNCFLMPFYKKYIITLLGIKSSTCCQIRRKMVIKQQRIFMSAFIPKLLLT